MATLLPPVAVVNPVMLNHNNTKDSRWLMLDVCREFTRNKCTRTEDECRFAHPSSNVEVQNGKVICCFDSIKGKCQRHDPPCKYLHPPQHLKEQLLQNGRRNLILKHIQTQFIMSGMQRVLPMHQYPGAQNASGFGTFYSPAYTSFPSLVPNAGPTASVAGPDTSGAIANEDVCNANSNDVNGENTTSLCSSQDQHQVWSGAGTPPTSVVAIDSNGYITSYCSPLYSPVYLQRACTAIPGMMPVMKSDAVADTKYELPVYQSPLPPQALTYPQMMISSSIPYQTPPYFPVMIPGPVASAVPRY